MTTIAADLLHQIPPANEIRDQLSKALSETRVLRQMLKAAESREKLLPQGKAEVVS